MGVEGGIIWKGRGQRRKEMMGEIHWNERTGRARVRGGGKEGERRVEKEGGMERCAK